ncbi:hypothetical protein A2763_01280 [Candidatus Kaiserbacteria bacterium RIFCSPHIGHO2_01_FULL_54_36]|uniref:Cell shape-determining protein MreC n=1 Tax=Candidatus Kaiserbacteria bacterium RIFCSPHIGHO2_01_FULL_54_36 TaxID=1798482 RepID=A0A1F6CMR0_9BACT|nr:MAG: hypothetical protein A2763_01280 [Candidatus Kaiserbacteria bacterium RIFCSPHIGHO2_01_FULL_54_36]OGG75752.1 MAG: hypothetical protein A3A41_00050 [Candidatus Kaiserbacteria bacterium RIFCSPLOWO2_01_FULL_54_22]
MKRTFTYRPATGASTGRRRLLATTALVVLVFVIDLASGGSIRHQLRGVASIASQWTSRVGSSIKGAGIFSSRAALEAQNRSLTEELSQFEERAAGYDALKAENAQLRALLNLVQSTPGQGAGVTAPVVSSVRSSPYGTFLIGAGSAEAIARGSLVQTSGGFVVGSISDVGAHTALVSEVFAPGASIEAEVAGSSILATGSGAGNARAEVPRGIPISPGDTVVASQLGQRPIGIVGKVASSTGSAVQTVYIRLPVNLNSLQYVYIVPIRN